jgi:hypothetical protein
MRLSARRIIPQGLKPIALFVVFGTTKVMP